MTGRQLRAWMRRHSYTDTTLGVAFGVDRSTVFRWRKLDRKLPYGDLIPLALEALASRQQAEKQ